jgi:hypothetical protein
MRELSESLDEAAWDAQEAGDEARYDSLFRQSRAVSALAFALSREPDEAIYEAAYAVGTLRTCCAGSPPEAAQPRGPAFGNVTRPARTLR